MIRIRVVIALVVVSVLFLSIVYNKFEQSLFSDKVENVELQMKNQISTMVSAFEADSKFLLKWANSLSYEGTRRINWNSMAPYFAVAHLNANFQVVEWSFRENSPVSSLSKETLTQLVYSFQVNPESTQISFQYYQDPDKKKILLTLVPAKDKLWVFASMGENLQSLMDSQKTLSSSLALVNKDMVSLAHVKPEYIGQKIFENPVIKDLKDSNKTSSSGSFKITSGEELFAVVEKVPNMELYLYSQSSLSDIIKSKDEFRRQFAFFSFGFLFILVGISFLLVPQETQKTVPTQAPKIDGPKPAAPVAVAEKKSPGVVSDFNKERTQNNMKVASALGHEMKAPLVKILSLVQVGNFATTKDDVIKVLNKVQGEARAANEIIEKLLLFAGEKEQNRINTKVDTPLLRAIKNLEALCYQKVVKVNKELGETDSFSMDVNQLVTVFENIIKNSVQAMDRKSNKEIKIKSYMKDGKVVVSIEDNGDGVPKEISEKIFDPFFTSMNVGQHLGLGLTVALGIAKQHNGNVTVDSERGRGARVFVEFGAAEIVAETSALPAVAQFRAPTPQTSNPIQPPSFMPSERKEASSKPSFDSDMIIIDDDSSDSFGEAPVANMKSGTPPSLPLNGQGTLNIPNVQNEVELSADEEKGFNLSQDTHGTGKKEDTESENEMFQELNLSAKPISMKPMDLNVDVDELFEVSNEVPVIPLKAPAMTPAPASNGSFITGMSVSMPLPVKRVRASDDYKVVIKKPGSPI